MNYRHAYHAGNFADVMKHSALALVLDHLKQKDKPFFVLDTHAGTGLTDLRGIEAQKTGEFRDGIARVLAEAHPHDALKPYLETLAALGCTGPAPALYPGSPLIAYQMARADDRLAFCELHPDDAATLRAHFPRNPQARVHEIDGYTALKSMLPPKERRGLILIDPPFEARDEFDRLARELDAALKRFATGTYMIWYPVKDPSLSGAFLDHMERNGPPKTLRAELFIRATDPATMSGCGLLIINPPWQLDETLTGLFTWLANILKQGEGARARVDWLQK
ncbi:MAG: 23S rRNA (adenine(2030)-N(6))-methyltransferase RlmJ [Parvibaculum sp.]|nr:23S rRNA (adenine(2030)-N(6))-methyltransferase RlmJ [Parvibaculum sp.]